MNTYIGTQIEQYRIDTLIAQGGMGAVYQATDLNLDRLVAIKLLHPHRFQNPEFRQRFLQEARAAARLNHPAIVRVYNFNESAELLYLVMEFINGPTLSTELRRLRQTGHMANLHETLLMLAQVADGLGYAHQQGVIHRDIKPGNIMLKPLDRPSRPGTPPFRAVVTDFGLAKLQHGLETKTGNFIGTLPFMSPEQCLDEPLDGRSDIYSLGIVLYQMSTGQLPFDVRTPTNAVQKHLHAQPIAPRSLQPTLPISVEAIINRALAKQPKDRFQTATEMAHALRQSASNLTDAAITQLTTSAWEGTTQVHSTPQTILPQPTFIPTDAAPTIIPPPITPDHATELDTETHTTILPNLPLETDLLGAVDGFTIHLNPVHLHVKPGQKASVQVELANYGRFADHFILQLRNVPAAWVSIPQDTIHLMPGSQSSLPFSIHPPADSSATAGERQYQLSLMPASNPSASVAATGKLIIAAFEKFSITAHPTQFINNGISKIHISNNGNMPVRYSLCGRDPAAALIFTGQKQQTQLPAGKTDNFAMGIRPKKRRWFGTAQACPYEIELRTNNGRIHTQTGQLTIQPRIPRWLIHSLTVLVPLLSFIAIAAARQVQTQVDATATAQAMMIATQTATRELFQTRQSESATATAVSHQNTAATATHTAATAIALGDDDQDGLTNQAENNLGTDPTNADTDGDQLLDGQEVNQYGTDPLHIDSDRDGLDDYLEIFVCFTVPTNADTDNDGTPDGADSHPLAWPTATSLPAPTSTPIPISITAQLNPAASGWVDDQGNAYPLTADVATQLIVGDTDGNVAARTFFSFDLTMIPNGALLKTAVLHLPQPIQSGTPFIDLSNYLLETINIGETLDQLDYVVPGGANLSDSNAAIAELNVLTAVQMAQSQSASQFQLRIRFATETDNDNSADNLQWTSLPTLIIQYTPTTGNS
ncbi:MAG: protein kinase [Chloroflexi bacterium]|nr:protein kinase [Chloroflexota bacterium]